MTHNNTTHESIGPIVDPDSLQDEQDIPVHEEKDVVDEAVVDDISSLPDMAGVGIKNTEGDVLFRRATDTCSWKIPVVNVGPNEDFVEQITAHISETIGFDIDIKTVAGVWTFRLRTEDNERTASRSFVIFEASADNFDLEAAAPTGDRVEEADWFDALPEGAEEVPGTGLFLD